MVHHKKLVAEPILVSFDQHGLFAEFPVHPESGFLMTLHCPACLLSFLRILSQQPEWNRRQPGNWDFHFHTTHCHSTCSKSLQCDQCNSEQLFWRSVCIVVLSSWRLYLQFCDTERHICVLSYKTFSFSLLWCGDHTVVSLNQGIQWQDNR